MYLSVKSIGCLYLKCRPMKGSDTSADCKQDDIIVINHGIPDNQSLALTRGHMVDSDWPFEQAGGFEHLFQIFIC